jgi:hypothetical protein
MIVDRLLQIRKFFFNLLDACLLLLLLLDNMDSLWVFWLLLIDSIPEVVLLVLFVYVENLAVYVIMLVHRTSHLFRL